MTPGMLLSVDVFLVGPGGAVTGVSPGDTGVAAIMALRGSTLVQLRRARFLRLSVQLSFDEGV